VLSPTYNLIREHRGAGGSLVHVDLYRLRSEETAALGLEELLAGPGVKVVEWAERLPVPPAMLARPPGAVWLALALRRLPEAGDDSREIVELAAGHASAAGLDRS
jgi:hypothetical protein